MKLNFWQWIGVVIVAIALIFIIKRELGPETTKPAGDSSPTTSTPEPAPAPPAPAP